MHNGITIGRIWGIPIRLDWTWFLIFALVTWSLAGGLLMGAYPELSPPALWLLGTLTSLLFFGSVLLHELGHAYIARRNGIRIDEIRLFILGGIAALGAEPRTPGAEFRIALAGPIVSFALAAVFGSLAFMERSVPWLATPSAWLAQINLLLALFNLLPGLPLDGGRMLRAAIWRWSGSLERANKAAAAASAVVGWGLVAYGAALIFAGNAAGGLWMLLIGWLIGSSAASLRRAGRPTRQPEQSAGAGQPELPPQPSPIRDEQPALRQVYARQEPARRASMSAGKKSIDAPILFAYGAILLVLGTWLVAGTTTPSLIAAIPALAGLSLVLLAVAVGQRRLRLPAVGSALLVALLGLAGVAAALGDGGAALLGREGELPTELRTQAALALACAALAIMSIKTFVDEWRASRSDASRQPPGSSVSDR